MLIFTLHFHANFHRIVKTLNRFFENAVIKSVQHDEVIDL